MQLLRFKHLVERGILNNRVQLKNLIDNCKFPPGRLLSPNTRVWTAEEIDVWFADRPVEKRPLKGNAKKLHEEAVAREVA